MNSLTIFLFIAVLASSSRAQNYSAGCSSAFDQLRQSSCLVQYMSSALIPTETVDVGSFSTDELIVFIVFTIQYKKNMTKGIDAFCSEKCVKEIQDASAAVKIACSASTDLNMQYFPGYATSQHDLLCSTKSSDGQRCSLKFWDYFKDSKKVINARTFNFINTLELWAGEFTPSVHSTLAEELPKELICSDCFKATVDKNLEHANKNKDNPMLMVTSPPDAFKYSKEQAQEFVTKVTESIAKISSKCAGKSAELSSDSNQIRPIASAIAVGMSLTGLLLNM
ncbi:hypothetical protein BKA69DRAFT_1178655 [Paraphysoderma sedebokerense]|nr:hypothetical protein BKA69DRAFT_1178655 [Paraphysoderma sedebokerense]